MDDAFGSQFRYAIQTLTSPAGAAALLMWLGLLVAIVASPKVKWVVVILLMWVATLSFFVAEHKLVRLAFPLEQIRSQGRPLCLAFLVALLIPAVTQGRGWRRVVVSPPVLLFFLFEMIVAALISVGGVTDRGAVSLMVYPMIFLCMGWGLSKWLQSWDDAYMLLRAIALTGAIFGITTAYQLAINQSAAMTGGRLLGTSGNPQHAAIFIALALPVVCFFATRPAENKVLRICFGVLIGLLFVFLLWTGSRTGMLMTAIGVGLTYRARLGRFVAIAIFGGAFVLLGVQIYKESTTSMMDMFVRGDTRTRVWSALFSHFMENPVMGGISGGYGVGENSYLATAANHGLIGLVPLASFVFLSGVMMWRLFQVRKLMGSEAQICDLIIAGLSALFVGAMFEGYLLGTLTFQVFCIYIYLAVGTFVLDAVKVAQEHEQMTQLYGAYADERDEMLVPARSAYAGQSF